MALAGIRSAVSHFLKRYLRSDRGNMTLIASLASIPMIAAAGMAVDYGRITRVKDKMQLIVDGAALAAVGAKNITGTTAEKSTKRIVIAKNYLTNGLATLTDAKLLAPPTITSAGTGVSISVTAQVRGSFMNVLDAIKGGGSDVGNGGAGSAAGIGNSRMYGITVKTTASFKSGASYLCILALNNTDSQSLQIQGTADLYAPGCAVWSNSSSNSGLYENGNATLTAEKICVYGGYSGSAYYPYLPKTGSTDCPRIADPLKTKFLTDYATTYASAKSSGGSITCTDGTTTFKCQYNGRTVGGSGKVTYTQLTYSGTAANVTLQPGIYDGGIQVKAGATVKLAAGTYFIQNGKFEVQNATVQNADFGTTGGVTIVLTEPTAGTKVTNSTQTRIDVQAQAVLQLKAPAAGAFAGIAVAQHPDSITSTSKTVANSVIGGGTKSITGMLYYPSNILYITGGGTGTIANPEKIATTDPLFAIVADKVYIEGNGQLRVGGSSDFEAAGLPALPTAGTGKTTVSLK